MRPLYLYNNIWMENNNLDEEIDEIFWDSLETSGKWK